MSNDKLENVVVANKLEKNQGRSPGSRLQKAREAKGISVEEIAKKLFLNTYVVHQLENDDYKNNHSVTFIRGYLRSYARLVDVDTETLIAEFNALGLTDAAPPMSTQRIYHRESSIIGKSMPWVGTVIGIFILLFVVMWVHSEFSNSQINNPTASAVKAVAATVTQTNNSVAALTPAANSLNVSSDTSLNTTATTDASSAAIIPTDTNVADTTIAAASASDDNTNAATVATADATKTENAASNSVQAKSDQTKNDQVASNNEKSKQAKSTNKKKQETVAEAKPKIAKPF